MKSIQIYLKSQYSDYFCNGESNWQYILPLMEIPDGCHIYVSEVSWVVPFFFNINSTNNVSEFSLIELQ